MNLDKLTNQKTVLFVNSFSKVCGIYQWGKLTYEEIKKSSKYKSLYMEPNNLNELISACNKFNIDILIVNYFQCLMPWLNTTVLKNSCSGVEKVLGVYHEPKQVDINRDKH
jgi:uncharacterized protein YlbG (UPF0298 family)